MDTERHVCDCGPGFSHPPVHIGCCRCIKCPRCRQWIKASFWPEHRELQIDEPLVPEAPSDTEREQVEETEPDSLRDALVDLDGVDLKDFDQEFRAAIRRCVEELIDHLELLGGPFVPDRTAAWKIVLGILFDQSKENEDKVEALLLYFDDREREAEVMGIVLSVEELFPIRART